MSTSLHSGLSQAEVHRPWRQVFPDASARTGDSTTYTAADAYKTALQTDTSASYYLSDPAVPTWTLIGGSGAPTNASYVVMSLDGTLSDERVLTMGSGLTAVDGGANAAVTLSLWLASQANGDIIYRGASNWERLGAGTVGQYLKTQSVGSAPVWADLPTYDLKPVLVQSTDSQQIALTGVTLTSALQTMAAGAFSFNTFSYPAASTYTFQATGYLSHAGMTMNVGLYNLTDREFVTGTTLTFTSTSAALQTSSVLTVGATWGNLRNSAAVYETRMVLWGGVGYTSIGYLGTSFLKVVSA